MTEALPGGTHSFRIDGGEVDIWLPAQRIVASRARGHLSAALALAAFNALERWRVESGGFEHGFGDYSDVTNYDWHARVVFVRYIASRRLFHQVHVLVRSKLVDLAAQAVALAMPGVLHVHRERDTYEEILRNVVERASATSAALAEAGLHGGHG